MNCGFERSTGRGGGYAGFGLCRLLKASTVFYTLIPVRVGSPLSGKEDVVLSQEQIKPFILHPVQMVRDFAAGYFHNHNYQPGDLMEWILKAVINYDASKCIRLLTASREFKINTDQLNTILDMLEIFLRKGKALCYANSLNGCCCGDLQISYGSLQILC